MGPVQITPRSADIQSQVVERIPIILYQVFVDAPQRKSELRMSQDKIVKKLQVGIQASFKMKKTISTNPIFWTRWLRQPKLTSLEPFCPPVRRTFNGLLHVEM